MNLTFDSSGNGASVDPVSGKRAVALVSGGLDSVVSLAIADRELDVRVVLFCNYGQRALGRERASVIDVATYYGLPYQEVDITWLRDLSPEGMRGSTAGETAVGQGSADGEVGENPRLDTLEAVWIPNRNGVFLNVAAAYAECYRCAAVVTGFNREEAVEFPDNSSGYVDAVNRSFEFSTRNGVRVVSYTLGLTKREIMRKGIELSVPFGAIWSCYLAGDRMCGTCGSCRRLQAAIDSLPADQRPPVEFEQ